MADETINLGADARQVQVAFEQASKSVTDFEKSVETGGKGAERSLALASVQIENLNQGIAKLKANGKPTEALEQSLGTLKGKLDAGTASLGRMRAAQADAADATRLATQRAGEFRGSITDVTGTLKTLSPEIGNAIDKYSALAAKAFIAVAALDAGAKAIKEVASAMGEYEGEAKESIDKTIEFTSALKSLDVAAASKALGSLIGTIYAWKTGMSESTVVLGEATKKQAEAVQEWKDAKWAVDELTGARDKEMESLAVNSTAILKVIEAERENGKVTEFTKERLKELLEVYEKRKIAIPDAIKQEADSLDVLTASQEKNKESAVKSAEARVAAEKKAAQEISDALAEQTKARLKAIADAEASYGEAIKKATEGGNQLVTDPNVDVDGANKKVGELQAQLDALNDTDLLTPEQQAQTETLSRDLAKARQNAEALNRTSILGVAPIIDQAEATGLLADNAKLLDAIWAEQAADHQKVLDGLARENQEAADIQEASNEAAAQFVDTAKDAAEAMGGAADATKRLGDEGKKINEDDPLKTIAESGTQAAEVLRECVSLSAQLLSNLQGAAAAV